MARRVLGPSGSKRRRTRLLLLVALAASAFAVVFVTASSGTLGGGSTFESGDGNLAVDGGAAFHDWNTPVETINCTTTPGTNCGTDLVGSQADNAFGQGAKEDDAAPTVVTGSIPPSKDDLRRFYVNKEKINGNDYLYLAWERSNLLGSAHMDFEFNQSSTLSANGVSPVRTANDILIDFDFGGSGVPVLALHRWITTGSASNCEASNSLPCWDKAVNLTAGGFAEGAVNSGPLTDNYAPGNPFTLDGNTKNGTNSTFGEAGINLTGANIFPPGTCETLGSAYLKSRSSGNSFTSELKDFIAPVPVHITNCGEIKIIKHTNPRGVNQAFGFSSTIPNTSTCLLDTTPNGTYTGSGTAGFALNDNGNTTGDSAANTEDCVNVPAGTYTVTEGADPASFVFNNFTCTSSGAGTSTNPSSFPVTTQKNVSITISGGGVVTCTYTNDRQLGAIKITKTSTKGDAPLAGAVFTIKTGDENGSQVNGSPATTGSDGTVCVGNLPFGTYSIKETSAPTGYKINTTAAQSVVVDNNASCSDASFGGETKSFTDTPLSSIQVVFTSLAGAGVTKSSIVCADSTPATVDPVSENGNADPAFDDTNETITNLEPGTYTCTVVVDP